jgi:uncharacterized protein YjbI with pentapeptide repeats
MRIVLVVAVLCALALWRPAEVTAAATVPRVCIGCNLAQAQLAGSDFSGVVYVGANFSEADLRNASFRGAKIIAANFENAKLQGAAFDAADCTACNFDGSKLDGATFAGVRMTAANFAGFASAVDNGQLRELLARCVACNFRSGQLGGRDFSNLSLISVDFSKADLQGTKFDGAVLCWNNTEGTQREVKCDKMADARVTGASFLNVRLCDDPIGQRECVPVDAAALRRYAGSPLTGAKFQ